MAFYDSRNPSALFTGFDLNTPEPEPDEEDIDGDEPDPAVEESRAKGELAALAHENGMTVDQVEDLWARFSGNQVYLNLANVASALAYFFGADAVLRKVNLHLATKDGPALFTVLFPPFLWWGVAGVGGFILAWEITILIWSLFTKRRTIRLYREWVRRATWDFKGSIFKNQLRFWHWCAVLLVLPITVCGILALNEHSLFRSTDVLVCGFEFKPCEVLEYRDIRHVEFYPAYGHGKGRVASKVVVSFARGRTWDSSSWFDGDADPAVTHFLMAKDPSRATPDLPNH